MAYIIFCMNILFSWQLNASFKFKMFQRDVRDVWFCKKQTEKKDSGIASVPPPSHNFNQQFLTKVPYFSINRVNRVEC